MAHADDGEPWEPAARKGVLVLAGAPERPKWLHFACPCACGEVVSLNLMRSHYPHWRVTERPDGTIDVYPSVWSQSCGSHYWIMASAAEWC